MVTSNYQVQDISIFGEGNEEVCLELHRIDTINETKYASDVACFVERKQIENWLKENPFKERLEQQKVIAPMGFPLISKGGTYVEPRSFEEWLEMVGKGERDEMVGKFIEFQKLYVNTLTQWQFNKLHERVKFEPFKKVAHETT